MVECLSEAEELKMENKSSRRILATTWYISYGEISIYLVGRMLSPDIIKTLMGDDFAADFSKVCIREQDNEMSRKLMGLLRKYHQSDQSYYQIMSPCEAR
ncbi:PREDICTED: protein transport protein Sec24-like At3g07100 [Ipomoea nil]|uniref:protein transport protein Sec24-like At3g07100 n=1 Tax=Ipomoea nil TaxID=35883 RepID=UPI0009014F8F|nr:PREDICTED: protein transport protein Sec24-like At3g07100 [Ipomoea nil]